MFFDQIQEIDGNLKDLRTNLKDIGSAVDVHFDQLDDIAAHVIALEALVAQVISTMDVDFEAAKEWIKENTKESSGNGEGSIKALTVLEDLSK